MIRRDPAGGRNVMQTPDSPTRAPNRPPKRESGSPKSLRTPGFGRPWRVLYFSTIPLPVRRLSGLKTLFHVLSSLAFLLSGAAASAQNVRTAAAASAPSANGPGAARTVLCLGDSLTAGYGLSNPSAQSFPALLQEKLRAQGDRVTEVINAGQSGDTTASGLRRLDWLLRRPIDILVLALGANDGLRGLSVEETQRNLQAIIEKVRAKNPGVRVLVAGMRLPPNYGENYTKRFEAIFPAIADANGAVLLPFLLEGVGGRAEFNQRDGVHPTAEGQRLMAESVWRYLKPMLQSVS